jgi:hypothetical protein
LAPDWYLYKLHRMAQFPVVAYVLQVSTAPRQRQQGVAPPDMIPAVFIQIEGRQAFPLQVQNSAEYMAICALLQTPGRLVFDPDEQKLQKVMP